MKKLLLITTLLFSFTLYAQVTDADISQFYHSASGRFGRYDDQNEVVKKINDHAIKIAKSKNIEVKKIKFDNIEALKILPSYSSKINQEALRVEREFGGMELIFFVYHLKRGGSNAFFNPDGSVIGVPKEFILGEFSESYFHELAHARTYQRIIKGLDDTYAGLYKALEGFQVSRALSGGYARFASLDEFKTTLYSASLSMKKLFDIYNQTQDKKAFYRNRSNEELLSEILHSLEVGANLSKQVSDIAERVITHLNQSEFELATTKLRLGSELESSVYSFKVLSDSYSAETAGRYTIHSKGSLFTFHSLTKDKTQLIKRLSKLSLEGKKLANEALEIKKLIGLRIMYADLATTDVPKLAKQLVNRFNF